jgi:hypothetical protein
MYTWQGQRDLLFFVYMEVVILGMFFFFSPVSNASSMSFDFCLKMLVKMFG